MESFCYLSLSLMGYLFTISLQMCMKTGSRGPCESFSYFTKGQQALVNSFFGSLPKGSISFINRFSHIKLSQRWHLYLLGLFLRPCKSWILLSHSLIKIKISNHVSVYFVKGNNTANYPTLLRYTCQSYNIRSMTTLFLGKCKSVCKSVSGQWALFDLAL